MACGGDDSVFQPSVDTDRDGVVDSQDDCPNQPGPSSNAGCPGDAVIDTDNDGIIDDEDHCPMDQGPIENNGCPWENLVFGTVTSPTDRQACLDIPIGITATNTTGGSNVKVYRYVIDDLTDETVENQNSAWQNSTSFSIPNSLVNLGHVYDLWLEVRDPVASLQGQYDKIRFHVRGQPDSENVPPVAAWITPVQNGGQASSEIEWSNLSDLTYDVEIDGALVASGISDTKYVHNLQTGSYDAKIISRQQNGSQSETATPFQFLVP